MFDTALYPKTKQVLTQLAVEDWLQNFYLAGGTALALQLGHRKSIDLDFFSQNFPTMPQLLKKLEPHQPTITQQAPGTLDVLIKQVQTSFLEYEYPLLKPFLDYKGLKMAGLADIACMKITAISSRGSKKDFVDLYFIMKKHPLPQLWDWFQQKYADVNYQRLHLLKSLVYFADAEDEPPLDYLQEVSWEEVKAYFQKEVLQLLPAE